MAKLTTLFYLFVIVVLGLFACFSYLMTTVNPVQLAGKPGPAVPVTTTASAATTPHSGPTPKPPPHPGGLMKLMDYDEGSLTGESRKQSKDPNKSKGRRSVQERRKNNPGIVIMKVADSDGRPRIEIVFYPKRSSNGWKIYKKNDNSGSKSRKKDLLRHTILNIMPNDSIVFDNKDISWKPELETEYTVSGDISDNTEATEVFDGKTLESSLLKISNHNEMATTLNNDLLLPRPPKDTAIENTHANVATETKIDIDEDGKTISYNDVSLENRDNLPHYTSQGYGGHTSDHNEVGTEQHTVLLSQLDPEQDTTLDSHQSDHNDTTTLTTDLNEVVKTILDEDTYISIETTDHLLLSTSSDLSQDYSEHLNETETGLGSGLINTSNEELSEENAVSQTLNPGYYTSENHHSDDATETEMKTDLTEEVTTSIEDAG